MTSADLLDEAVAELYSADPDEFTQRRQEFVGRARAAGQAAVARQIAALRKPTRSAWVINRLARSDPGAVGQLDDLGRDLRAAERARDGAAMRELAQRRRQLIAALVRQALAASGQAAAPAAMREELTGTFAAAIADPEVAAQIQQGTLVRAVQRAAFGSSQPTLAVVPSPSDGRQRSKAKPGKAKPGKTKAGAAKTESPDETALDETAPDESAPDETGSASTRAGRAAAAEQRRAQARAAEEQRRAQARAAAERRLAEVRAKAERAVADADQAAAAAESDQLEQQMAIRRLERELTEARRKLRAAGTEARRAEAAQRRARQALDRLDG